MPPLLVCKCPNLLLVILIGVLRRVFFFHDCLPHSSRCPLPAARRARPSTTARVRLNSPVAQSQPVIFYWSQAQSLAVFLCRHAVGSIEVVRSWPTPRRGTTPSAMSLGCDFRHRNTQTTRQSDFQTPPLTPAWSQASEVVFLCRHATGSNKVIRTWPTPRRGSTPSSMSHHRNVSHRNTQKTRQSILRVRRSPHGGPRPARLFFLVRTYRGQLRS